MAGEPWWRALLASVAGEWKLARREMADRRAGVPRMRRIPMHGEPLVERLPDDGFRLTFLAEHDPDYWINVTINDHTARELATKLIDGLSTREG